MQPKQYTDPKIALLNIELELKAERDNAEVRLENVEVINILAIMTLIKMFNDTSLSWTGISKSRRCRMDHFVRQTGETSFERC